MKNIWAFFIFYSFIFPVSVHADEEDNQALLKQLDELISKKETFYAVREKRIHDLKEQLRLTSDIQERFVLCGSLFNEYLHYQADSALIYMKRRRELLSVMQSPELKNEVLLNRAEVMGVMGMYNEALADLKNVDVTALHNKKLLPHYYNTCRTCYGWLANYTAERVAKDKYLRLTDMYRDSILLYSEADINHDIVLAEKKVLTGKLDEAIAMLEKMTVKNTDIRQQAYVRYTLSEAYELKRDTMNLVRCLIQTVIVDIQSAVREYAALQKLSRIIFATGDVERAYRYLTCSIEDAVACNARLRFMEVTEFYPIIDKAYKEKERHEKRLARNMLLSVSLLAFLLIVGMSYLYYWMKKLSVMRRHLYTVNRQLLTTNRNLEQTGKIKEVYIARYLARCVGYLEKLEHYRRSLEKLAMASKRDELFKAIRSGQFIRDEMKNFYNEFDKSFIDLFPTFIQDFNNLLTGGGKIYPKQGEILNTELRIFALIRLGVTDANRIAHFLGCSLATVYNYRSKIRNKAAGDKDRFEQDVMKL